MGPTRSDSELAPGTGQQASLRAVREDVLARSELTGAPLRAALCEAYDGWLAPQLPASSNVALVAVGGLGRREPAPYSDLDLVLVHDGHSGAVGEVAEQIWYPIWDCGLSLDHAIRTPAEALAVARSDLPALLGMLALRHIAGDQTLTARLHEQILQLWRSSATRRAGELRELAQQRWEIAGDAAFLLEPDLKQAHGGLRDVIMVQALALAQLVDYPDPVRAAYSFLLDVRGELHRHTRRASDVLRGQDHDGVAAALGIDSDSAGSVVDDRADELLRRVNLAARRIEHSVDAAFRRARASRSWSPLRRPARVPLARDVVAHDGEVVLARDAAPGTDPGLLLRVARAAAEHALPVAPFTLRRLGEQFAPLPDPWPENAREDFVAVLGAGPASIPVLESLDLAGLLAPLLPGWDAVRGRAQHNPVHRYTVDRHLLETAAAASRRSREVARPDLLLVAALLHDLGKGRGGDHSIAGAPLAEAAAARMGFAGDDVTAIGALTRHHLLLADTATGRDLDDPKTITAVAEAIGGSGELLELLHALTVADAEATGPAAWSAWKAGLVDELVRRVRADLHGIDRPPLPGLDAEQLRLAEDGSLFVLVRDERIVVAAPDTIGVLYRTAGVLALHGLDVRAASIRTHADMAVNTFDVRARFGQLPELSVLRADLARTLTAASDLAERLREKERAYGRSVDRVQAPSLHWLDDAATDATVLEVRAESSIGLLCRLTAALERCRLDVRSARIRSMGNSVIDTFYLTTRAGGLVPELVRAEVATEMRNA